MKIRDLNWECDGLNDDVMSWSAEGVHGCYTISLRVDDFEEHYFLELSGNFKLRQRCESLKHARQVAQAHFETSVRDEFMVA